MAPLPAYSLGHPCHSIWCLNGKKLRNAKGVWISASEWTLPDPGKLGVIKDVNRDKVLEVSSTRTYAFYKEEVDGMFFHDNFYIRKVDF